MTTATASFAPLLERFFTQRLMPVSYTHLVPAK